MDRFFLSVRKLLWHSVMGNQSECEREKRRLAFALLGSRSEEVTFFREGFRWTVPSNDLGVSRMLFVYGDHCGADIAGVLGFLRATRKAVLERSWIVDVGANLGSSTLPLAQASGKRILAIEPVPENFSFLSRNIAQNGLSQKVRALPLAISESAGHLLMARHILSGSCEIQTESTQEVFAEEARGTVKVETLPLGGLLEREKIDPAEIALVWSDTQGHESQVIESGRKIWAAGTPLFVELNPGCLNRHGGTERFVRAASENFRSFVVSSELGTNGERPSERPMKDLDGVLRSLGDGETDGLFLP